MSIPANIATEWANLQAQVAAAAPIANATFPTIKAIQLNIDNLRDDIDAALATTTLLDTWAPIADPGVIIGGFAGVVTAAQDESNLSLMRGILGRVEHNTDQLV